MSDPIGQPFDDIRQLITDLPEFEPRFGDETAKIVSALGDSLSPLGRAGEALVRMSEIQGASPPRVLRPLIAVFAGTHGVAQTVMGGDIIAESKKRVESLTEGRAAVRGIAADMGAAFKVYEFGTDVPSGDFTTEESLSERDCAAAMAFGMEVVAEGADVIVLGSAGYGAATAAAAVARGLFGGASDYWAGGAQAQPRIDAVSKGGGFHSGHYDKPLDVLRIFGGRDIAGLAGAILAAGHQRIPVILDGYVVCAAAAVLHAVDPRATAHCLAGHVTSEPAHQALLDRLELSPLLNLGLNIGDGTGAAMAFQLLQSATAGLGTLKD